VEDRFIVVATAALVVVAGVAGCSSSSSPPEPPGSLPPLTAHVTINGQDAGTPHSVDCSQDQRYMTVSTGDETHGFTAVVESVDSGASLVANSVQINSLGGFTGSYWRNLVGNGTASQVGQTYTITGTATGFNTDHPEQQATGTFTIKAAC
jgi:ipoprotein LpqH